MKLQPDRSDAQIITSHGDGWVAVNGERIEHSVIVVADGRRIPWSAQSHAALTPAHFSELADLGVEVIVLGTGRRLRFPPPGCLRPLVGRGVGLESMDTPAACRTYNILAQEGRTVAAALLIETS